MEVIDISNFLSEIELHKKKKRKRAIHELYFIKRVLLIVKIKYFLLEIIDFMCQTQSGS